MRVWFICGYRSDLANRLKKNNSEAYWDAYFFVWAVKVGSFYKPFVIHKRTDRVRIKTDNFSLVRRTFGQFVTERIASESPGVQPLLVPIPSKDGLRTATAFRTWTLVSEAMQGTPYAHLVVPALRWTQTLPKAHEGGQRRREFLRPYLYVDPVVQSRDIVLIDDLLSTGGSLLAAHDVLSAAGANVLGAVTCGRTIMDHSAKAFGCQHYDLEEEISEYSKAAGEPLV